MNCGLKSFRVARLAPVVHPEVLGQLYGSLEAVPEQYEVDEHAALDRGTVEKTGLRRRQPCTQKERQGPYVKLGMVLAGCRIVFEHVRPRHAEHAGAVWPLPNFAAEEVSNLLGRRVCPAIADLAAAQRLFDDLLESRQRMDPDRPSLDS